MSFLEAIRLALQQIRVQKLKSFFTLTGVMIGVTFLIAVVSIVGGMSRYMTDQVVGKIMAVNSFELRHRPNINMGEMTEERWRELRRRPRIRDTDVQPVADALPPDVKWAVVGQDNLSAQSRYVAKPRQVMTFTVSEDYFDIKKMAPVSGRLLSPQEYERGLPVIVIGQDVAEYFFPSLDPVGRELVVRGLPYTVVGVMEKQGSAFGISFDKFIIGAHKSALNRYVNAHGVIDAMMIQTPSREGMLSTMESVRQVMRARHHLRPNQKDDFELETSDSALEFWNKIKSYLVFAGVALPAIGLVVGAIVIMNIMLVAVAERTREIGIRKSLGARRSDLVSQFLSEAVVLSTFGGVLGVGLGVAFALAVRALTPLPAAIQPWSVLISLFVASSVGLFFGVYPATRAARLDPIVALRQE